MAGKFSENEQAQVDFLAQIDASKEDQAKTPHSQQSSSSHSDPTLSKGDSDATVVSTATKPTKTTMSTSTLVETKTASLNDAPPSTEDGATSPESDQQIAKQSSEPTGEQAPLQSPPGLGSPTDDSGATKETNSAPQANATPTDAGSAQLPLQPVFTGDETSSDNQRGPTAPENVNTTPTISKNDNTVTPTPSLSLHSETHQQEQIKVDEPENATKTGSPQKKPDPATPPILPKGEVPKENEQAPQTRVSISQSSGDDEDDDSSDAFKDAKDAEVGDDIAQQDQKNTSQQNKETSGLD